MQSRIRRLAIARARARAQKPVRDQATKLLALHGRWSPLLDTSLKLAGVAWVLMSFLSGLLLNDYLGMIGQTGVPLDLAGTWAILALLGGVLVLALSALGIMFIGANPIMAVLHDGGPPPLTTRIGFFVSAMVAVLAVLLMGLFSQSAPGVTGIAVMVGVATGILIFRIRKAPFLATGYDKPVGLLLLWVVMATVLFVILAGNLESVLRMQLGGMKPWIMALVIAAVQMCVCFFLSRRWVLVGTAIGAAWLTMFISPGPRVIVLTTLYLSNLGGGVPAAALSSPQAAKICNLGTADRPVIYFSGKGCTKHAALQHFRQLSEAADAAERSEIIACWRQAADQIEAKRGQGDLGHRAEREAVVR